MPLTCATLAAARAAARHPRASAPSRTSSGCAIASPRNEGKTWWPSPTMRSSCTIGRTRRRRCRWRSACARDGVRRELDDGGEQRAPVVVIDRRARRARPRDSCRWCGAFGRLLPKRGPSRCAARGAESPKRSRTLPMFAEYEIAEQLLVRDLMTDRPRTTTGDHRCSARRAELIRSASARCRSSTTTIACSAC